jgi:hypothetical protein
VQRINRGDLADCRERLGSTPRWSTKSRWPERIRGFAYEANSRWFDSTQRVQLLAADGVRLVPSEGALRQFDSASRVQICRSGPDGGASPW